MYPGLLVFIYENGLFFLLNVTFGWFKKRNHCPLLTADTVRGDGGTLSDEWIPRHSHPVMHASLPG